MLGTLVLSLVKKKSFSKILFLSYAAENLRKISKWLKYIYVCVCVCVFKVWWNSKRRPKQNPQEAEMPWGQMQKSLLGILASSKTENNLKVAQMVKTPVCMQETQVQSLSREDSLEKEMAIHSSTLAWKIPWMEEPCRLQSMGSQRVGHDWATSLSLFKEGLL